MNYSAQFVPRGPGNNAGHHGETERQANLNTASNACTTLNLSAETMSDLVGAILEVSAKLDDPERIAAIRLDEATCCAEMDLAPQASH